MKPGTWDHGSRLTVLNVIDVSPFEEPDTHRQAQRLTRLLIADQAPEAPLLELDDSRELPALRPLLFIVVASGLGMAAWIGTLL